MAANQKEFTVGDITFTLTRPSMFDVPRIAQRRISLYGSAQINGNDEGYLSALVIATVQATVKNPPDQLDFAKVYDMEAWFRWWSQEYLPWIDSFRPSEV